MLNLTCSVTLRLLPSGPALSCLLRHSIPPPPPPPFRPASPESELLRLLYRLIETLLNPSALSSVRFRSCLFGACKLTSVSRLSSLACAGVAYFFCLVQGNIVLLHVTVLATLKTPGKLCHLGNSPISCTML